MEYIVITGLNLRDDGVTHQSDRIVIHCTGLTDSLYLNHLVKLLQTEDNDVTVLKSVTLRPDLQFNIQDIDSFYNLAWWPLNYFPWLNWKICDTFMSLFQWWNNDTDFVKYDRKWLILFPSRRRWVTEAALHQTLLDILNTIKCTNRTVLPVQDELDDIMMTVGWFRNK